MTYLVYFAAAFVVTLSSSNVATAYEKEAATTRRALCELSECTTVCPSNLTDFHESMYSSSCNGEGVTTLKLLVSEHGLWATAAAERFSMERPDVDVEIIELAGNGALFENIINEAKSKTGLFDIFITPPHVMGDIVEEDGWADLTDYVESSAYRGDDWSDILVGYRNLISQFQDRILMFPLDGDVLSMFYREDVLEEFGLQVPRTWDEYNAVANATHGKNFKNKTLTGSCVGRMKGCAGAYWMNLVLSSMTQMKGMSSGSLFDTSDMTPLLGEAFVKALEWMEIQAMFGPEREFDGCVGINKEEMNDGSCVLTYNWGNSFMAHLREGSVFEKGEGKLGVAMTPGSTHVLDRTSMKLVPCDEKLCSSGGIYYDDIGWVNRSPYLAFGGWACAVNNYTTPEKKALATEYCAYASSRAESKSFFSSNASSAATGPDPFRKSHLDYNMWVDNGFESGSVIEYFDTISRSIGSQNAVLDISFPISQDIYGLLDEEVHAYLNDTVTNKILESERPSARQAIGNRLEEGFNAMVYDYNSKASTRSTLLQQYQKLRNVYTVEINMNYLGDTLRYYGYSIGILQMSMAIGFAIWTYIHRSSPVIRASQPFFLILLCVGVFTFSASIIPMIIDDEHFSDEACNKACMSLPWLICLGWSILFSALYAKLRRINLVIGNARAFRAVRISEKDMMVSFSILFTSNLVLIMLWNILDPMVWKRRQISPTESIGFCTLADTSTITWKIIFGILGILNGGVLIVANVEAYKARKIDTEYGESVYIGLIMLFFLQIVLVGVPLFFIVQSNSTARFFLTSSMVFIMSMSVLLLIFIPKYIRNRNRLREGRNNGGSSRSRVSIGGLKINSTSNMFEEAEKSIKARILYEKTWKERISSLQAVLEEAGIDAKLYLKTAEIIDDHNKILPIEERSQDDDSKSKSFIQIVSDASSKLFSVPSVIKGERSTEISVQKSRKISDVSVQSE